MSPLLFALAELKWAYQFAMSRRNRARALARFECSWMEQLRLDMREARIAIGGWRSLWGVL